MPILRDIFAACELYRRLYERVRRPKVAGICYRTMSHSIQTSPEPSTPPEATVTKYLDTFWQLEDCMQEVEDALGVEGYLMWASCRLLGLETAEEGWEAWLSLPRAHRPSELRTRGRWYSHWQSNVRTGDLILDRVMQEGRLLQRPE